MQQLCKQCNQQHFIPKEDGVCLACGYKRSHSKKIAAFVEEVKESYSQGTQKALLQLSLK